MRLQLATILIGLCGATLAAPAHQQRDKRLWPFPFPGEGLEPGPEPALPFPSLPFPSLPFPGLPFPGAPDDENGFPPIFPRPPSAGGGTWGGESPSGSVSEDGEGPSGLPWQLSGADEQDGDFQGPRTADEVLGEEESGLEE
ncbi:uncharacterized protein DSM5745_04686 [Aspergillus mulundensis]|uniref:Uncharacterized protein n=1 Tax=Aspergillus mulundensis TaxID=1810919 RepID=A0A3D8S4C1_9EURO|nr:hypothetical protein DSM5745_04686 [Aspergillus mulundensis]RDW81129.1 hypothetical protein DSM5745_04686 [Aspergillus mulundensis]